MYNFSKKLNPKQEMVINTLIEVSNFQFNSLNDLINPEDVFSYFVSKYIFVDTSNNPTGYKDNNGNSTNEFEKTLFFQHICAYLRQKKDKSYIIDNQVDPMFKVLSIPYKINHFDPRIYNYIGK